MFAGDLQGQKRGQHSRSVIDTELTLLHHTILSPFVYSQSETHLTTFPTLHYTHSVFIDPFVYICACELNMQG